jgi:DNA polymerase I-like protein with 3'-5' exonuclease and polymerase domains
MLDLILSGADAHGVTATELFGVSKEDGGWKQYRNVAKRGNFSLIFDVGAKTFQGSLSKIGIEWPLSKIEPMITKWKYELYPEFRKAVFKVMESAEANGYVRLINGRLCWFTADERKFDLHLAFNRFVQASLAELGTEWMLYIEANHPGILVNWVHDACYLHVPHGEEWRVDEVKAEGIRLFTAMFDVPGDCDITLESKGARA